MHFLFSLLRIKGLYMFQALLAHPQEAFHQWHLVYCVHVLSVGCTRIGVKLAMASSTHPGARYGLHEAEQHRCNTAIAK
jgi:hypothetical protein